MITNKYRKTKHSLQTSIKKKITLKFHFFFAVSKSQKLSNYLVTLFLFVFSTVYFGQSSCKKAEKQYLKIYKKFISDTSLVKLEYYID